jgi:sec-independent protein translocase protein TatA
MWSNVLTGWHLLILVGLGVLVFGYRKLPEAARSLGKSMRIFKAEMRELQQDGKDGKSEEAPKPNPVQSERVDQPAPDENHTDARPT